MTDELDDLELPDAMVLRAPFPLEDGFTRLKSETQWQQKFINIYGQKRAIPRLTAWYGDPGCSYAYSGIKNEPLTWTPLLLEIKDRLQSMLQYEFNSVLLNLYRDGSDSIGMHSDDEKELGRHPCIASLSFGSPRTFIFRHKEKRYRDIPVVLEDQSLLLMMGETQEHWLHGINKIANAGERINLTFRRIFNSPIA